MNEKLTLAPNMEYKIKGLYDAPFIGKSDYGEYYSYTVEHEGKTKTLFAKEYQMGCLEIAGFKKDIEATIKNVQLKPQTKIIFKVKIANAVTSSDKLDMTMVNQSRNNIIEATKNRLGDKFKAEGFLIKNLNGTIAPQSAPGSTKSAGVVQSAKPVQYAYPKAVQSQMSKEDWERKERRIARIAIIKELIHEGKITKANEEEKRSEVDMWMDIYEDEKRGQKVEDNIKGMKDEPEIPTPVEEEAGTDIKISDIPF